MQVIMEGEGKRDPTSRISISQPFRLNHVQHSHILDVDHGYLCRIVGALLLLLFRVLGGAF